MFLHLGNGYVVRNQDIIGIFDEKIFNEKKKELGSGYLKAVKANRKLLDKEKEAGRVLDCLYEVSGEKEKSLVFTDENTYLSPISPRALKGRLNDSLNQCFHRKI